MPTNGTMSYIISMLRQINQTTSVLSQNQNLLFEQFKILEQKVDKNYIKLDEKIDKLDNKINQIDKKFDNKINQLEQTIVSMQKEIKDMHEDITTIYTLETDSRKKLQKIM